LHSTNEDLLSIKHKGDPKSDNCPHLLKADVEKAKQNFNVDNLDDPVENQFVNEMPQQPDWMKLIKPNPNYEEIDESNFKYDDGGPEYDWGLTSHHLPEPAVPDPIILKGS
jgi:hypothetical protein